MDHVNKEVYLHFFLLRLLKSIIFNLCSVHHLPIWLLSASFDTKWYHLCAFQAGMKWRANLGSIGESDE